VKQYFKSVIEKRLTDAGRILDRLEQTATDNNWKKGYIKALQGIFLVLKSRNLRYAYIGQIHEDDPKKINGARRRLLKKSRNHLQRDFDKGFFTAWVDYLKVLKK